jgi:hypothetical protein
MKIFLHAHTNNKHSISLGAFLLFPHGRRFRFRYYSPLLNLLYRYTHIHTLSAWCIRPLNFFQTRLEHNGANWVTSAYDTSQNCFFCFLLRAMFWVLRQAFFEVRHVDWTNCLHWNGIGTGRDRWG